MKESDFISQFDYCYYFDADMAIIDKVGDEILGDLVATKHPGQSFHNINDMTYDRNQNSLAYVPYGEGKTYYAGGFNGGKTKNFLKMSKVISERVNDDLERGVIALWHDESHMNRYMIDNPPTLSLSPSYCYPEAALKNPQGWILSSNFPEIKPKILALDKNYTELRK